MVRRISALSQSVCKWTNFRLLVIPSESTAEGGEGRAVSLLSAIAQYADGSRGLLSSHDDKLEKEKALMNFHYDVQSLPPKDIYDGVMVVPKATYINPFPSD